MADVTLTDFLSARIRDDEHKNAMARDDGFDTARFEAEIMAKRRVVDLAVKAAESAQRMGGMPTLEAMEEGRASLGGEILRALAAVYSDHPDYRESWA